MKFKETLEFYDMMLLLFTICLFDTWKLFIQET